MRLLVDTDIKAFLDYSTGDLGDNNFCVSVTGSDRDGDLWHRPIYLAGTYINGHGLYPISIPQRHHYNGLCSYG